MPHPLKQARLTAVALKGPDAALDAAVGMVDSMSRSDSDDKSTAAGQVLNMRELAGHAIKGGQYDMRRHYEKASRLFEESFNAFESGDNAKGKRLLEKANAHVRSRRDSKMDDAVEAADRLCRRSELKGHPDADEESEYEITLTLESGKVIKEKVKAAWGGEAEAKVRKKHGNPKAKARVDEISRKDAAFSKWEVKLEVEGKSKTEKVSASNEADAKRFAHERQGDQAQGKIKTISVSKVKESRSDSDTSKELFNRWRDLHGQAMRAKSGAKAAELSAEAEKAKKLYQEAARKENTRSDSEPESREELEAKAEALREKIRSARAAIEEQSIEEMEEDLARLEAKLGDDEEEEVDGKTDGSRLDSILTKVSHIVKGSK